MDPSIQAEEELQRIRQREEDMRRMEEEVVWPQVVIVAAVLFALWIADKWLHEEVRKQETIEYKQEQLKTPKHMEM